MTTRSRGWIVGLVSLAAVLVAWSLLPWEWSMIDDPGFALSVRSAVNEHGAVLGPLAHVWQMVEIDLSWGLFRPAYWIYPSVVYLLPIGPAHALRLLLLMAAVAGPAVAARRAGARWPLVIGTLLIVLSASTVLARGLFYVSLQELSGAAFIGLGLMARRRGWRVGLWVVAAWFKSPFAWVLIGEAIALWRRGERRAAAVTGGIGAATLGLGVVFARQGSYTAAYGDGIVQRALANAPGLVSSSLILLLVAWAWWLVVSRSGIRWSSLSTTFAIGTAGYAALVLPWSVAAHYPGPVFYLAGLLVVSTLRDPSAISRSRALMAVAGPAVVSAVAVSLALIPGFAMNSTLLGISRCVVEEGDVVVALSPDVGEEQVLRIQQNVELRSPEWQGKFVVPPDGGASMLVASADLLVVPNSVGDVVTGASAIVCDLPYAQVLRVAVD